MRVHIKQGFQQGMAVRNREKQKTEADRDRTSKKAYDEQPADDQLYGIPRPNDHSRKCGIQVC